MCITCSQAIAAIIFTELYFVTMVAFLHIPRWHRVFIKKFIFIYVIMLPFGFALNPSHLFKRIGAN